MRPPVLYHSSATENVVLFAKATRLLFTFDGVEATRYLRLADSAKRKATAILAQWLYLLLIIHSLSDSNFAF